MNDYEEGGQRVWGVPDLGRQMGKAPEDPKEGRSKEMEEGAEIVFLPNPELFEVLPGVSQGRNLMEAGDKKSQLLQESSPPLGGANSCHGSSEPQVGTERGFGACPLSLPFTCEQCEQPPCLILPLFAMIRSWRCSKHSLLPIISMRSGTDQGSFTPPSS